MKANNDVVVTPIYYWSEKDVWDYITLKEIQTNPLYEMGYSRVGCIGCPLSSHSIIMRQFNQYPTYKRAYIKAFEKMLEKRKNDGKDDVTGKEGFHCWKTGEDVFDWWMEGYKRECKGQINLFDEVTG